MLLPLDLSGRLETPLLFKNRKLKHKDLTKKLRYEMATEILTLLFQSLALILVEYQF